MSLSPGSNLSGRSAERLGFSSPRCTSKGWEPMKKLMLLAVGISLFAVPSHAQSVDASLSYSYFRLGGSNGTNQNGVSGSLAFNHLWLGIVGDFPPSLFPGFFARRFNASARAEAALERRTRGGSYRRRSGSGIRWACPLRRRSNRRNVVRMRAAPTAIRKEPDAEDLP